MQEIDPEDFGGIYSDFILDFKDGSCDYFNADKEYTLCNLTFRLKNNGSTRPKIKGEFVAGAGYKEEYNYASGTMINAEQVTSFGPGNPRIIDSEIEGVLNPHSYWDFRVAYLVPTGSQIQGARLENTLDSINDYDPTTITENYFPMTESANICALGSKSKYFIMNTDGCD